MRDLQANLELVKDFIVKIGDETYDNWDKLSIVKQDDSGANPTTNYDLAIELKFKELIKDNFPEDSIIGEEGGRIEGLNEYTWYIDPIDGTKYFANKVPYWGVTISLLKDNEPVLGVIYNPVSKQLYHALKDSGAFLNGTRLKMAALSAKSTQIFWDYVNLNIDFANLDSDTLNKKIYDQRFELTQDFYRVRETGSGQYSLTNTVCMSGAYISPLRKKSKYMDISAGLLLAQEAGATIVRYDLTDELEYVIAAKQEHIDLIHTKFNFLHNK